MSAATPPSRPIAMRHEVWPVEDRLIDELQIWLEDLDPGNWMPPRDVYKLGMLNEISEDRRETVRGVREKSSALMHSTGKDASSVLTLVLGQTLHECEAFFIDPKSKQPKPRFFPILGLVLVQGLTVESALQRNRCLQLDVRSPEDYVYSGFRAGADLLSRTIHPYFPDLLDEVIHKFAPCDDVAEKNLFEAAHKQTVAIEQAFLEATFKLGSFESPDSAGH